MPIINNQNRPQQQAGSGFTNLQRYLQANKANRLGSSIAGGIQQAGQATRGAIQQAGETFKTEADKEKARLGTEGQRAENILGNVPAATNEDVQHFQGVLGAQSLGPTGIKNTDEIRAKAQEAQQLGQAGGTQAGRFGLLQRFVGGNRPYTVGQQRLDQLLLGQTGGQALRGAKAGTIGLGQEAERQISSAQAQGEELKGQARQLAEATKDKTGQVISQYDQAMKDQLAQQMAANQAVLDRFAGTGTNEAMEFDPTTLQQLSEATGGVLGEGKQLYNADISPYLQLNKLYATSQGAQTQQDLAKAQMLSKLAGNYLAGRDSDALLQSYAGHPELAGSYSAHNAFQTTSESDLNDAINKQKAAYEAARAAAGENIHYNTDILANRKTGLYAVPGGVSIPDLINNYIMKQGGQDAQGNMALKPMSQEELNDLNSKMYQSDQFGTRRTNYQPTEEEQLRAALNQINGAISASGSVTSTQMTPYTDTGMDYLNKAYNSGYQLMPWMEKALAANTSGAAAVQSELNALKEAQNQYTNVLPAQFQVLRALKAKQAAPNA